MGVVGQGVAHRTAGELAEAQETEHLFGQSPLHGHDPAVELHTGSQGIAPLLRPGNVGGLAVNIHLHLAGAGHHLV